MGKGLRDIIKAQMQCKELLPFIRPRCLVTLPSCCVRPSPRAGEIDALAAGFDAGFNWISVRIWKCGFQLNEIQAMCKDSVVFAFAFLMHDASTPLGHSSFMCGDFWDCLFRCVDIVTGFGCEN